MIIPVKSLLLLNILQGNIPEVHPRFQHLEDLGVDPSGIEDYEMRLLPEQPHVVRDPLSHPLRTEGAVEWGTAVEVVVFRRGNKMRYIP